MNEDETRNYLMNTINSTFFFSSGKIYRDDKKFNKRNEFYRIKKYIDNSVEKKLMMINSLSCQDYME